MVAQLFLMSSSRVAGGGYLEFARDALREFLGDCRTIYFVPFAIADYDRYTSDVAAAFESFNVRIVGLHTVEALPAIESAEVLFVGGGNSFRLLKRLQQLELIEPVQRRVRSGALCYIGASAGSNMACPSLRTT